QSQGSPMADENLCTVKATVEEPPELIVNLTSDVNEEPESSLMALHFADKALENDIPVTVFMNVRGVKLASNASADVVFNGENLQGIIKSILNKGGKVVACPMCMKVQGVEESELMDGIEVSSTGFMMQKLRESPTVFTY
ncbi:MAG: DsrE family protein, partial [Cyclobacteriaceae bacterium]